MLSKMRLHEIWENLLDSMNVKLKKNVFQSIWSETTTYKFEKNYESRKLLFTYNVPFQISYPLLPLQCPFVHHLEYLQLVQIGKPTETQCHGH